MITREAALAFVNERIANKNIVKHMLATEACLRAIGEKLGVAGEELEHWALAGLLHDADYSSEVPAEEQGVLVTKLLRERGQEIPEAVAHAMAAHNAATGIHPEAKMDWAIFCADTLTGLIVATTLVRPDKKLAGVAVESVLKKYRSPSFAAGTRRDEIAQCAPQLGIALEDFVGLCLTAMQGIAGELGL